MKRRGTVVRWDDARGFGFIRTGASTADVFFHVRDFRGAGATSPHLGLAVTFEEVHVGGKGPRAMAVQAVGQATSTARGSAPARPVAPRRAPRQADNTSGNSGAIIALPLMLAYAAVILWGVWMHRLPLWVLMALPLLSLMTFFAYWQDKYAAQQGRWRIKEDTLHLWSLAGGWPGAWWAQQVLRHKSRKASFRTGYWTTVSAHCTALGAWLWWLSPRWPL